MTTMTRDQKVMIRNGMLMSLWNAINLFNDGKGDYQLYKTLTAISNTNGYEINSVLLDEFLTNPYLRTAPMIQIRCTEEKRTLFIVGRLGNENLVVTTVNSIDLITDEELQQQDQFINSLRPQNQQVS